MKVSHLGVKMMALAIAMISSGALDAGQIELFWEGTPNPSASPYYQGTIGFGVSNNGVVAATANLGGISEKAFTYTTGGTKNVLQANGRALTINGAGTAAAGYIDGLGGATWQVGSQSLTHLNTLLGYTQGSGFSRNGQYIVGVGGSGGLMSSWNADGTGGMTYNNLGGTFVGWANGISDNGIIGGTISAVGARPAGIANIGVSNSTQVLGQGYLDGSIATPYGKVLGINSNGTILVGESDIGVAGTVYSQAFIYNSTLGNTMQALGTLPGYTNFAAQSLSESLFSGSPLIVGNAWTGDTSTVLTQAAMIWDPVSGPSLLSTYALTNWGVNLPAGYSLLTAYSISANGTYIAGSARDASGNQVGYLITVPEPASVISLSVGLAAVAYVRMRRGRKAN